MTLLTLFRPPAGPYDAIRKSSGSVAGNAVLFVGFADAAAGNKLVLQVAAWHGGVDTTHSVPSSVTAEGKTTAWTKHVEGAFAPTGGGTGQQVSIWSADVTQTGYVTVTVNFPAAVYAEASITEHAGLAAGAAAFDKGASASGDSANDATPSVGPTASTSGRGLVVALLGISGGQPASGIDAAAPGYTNAHLVQDSAATSAISADWKGAAAAGAHSAEWGTVAADAGAWSAAIATFRAAQPTLLFSDEFSSLSLRNGIPSGANKVRNSAGYGAAVGVAPENWILSPAAGLTATVTGFGTATADAQTVPYVDVRVQGTGSAAAESYLLLDGPVIPAAAGQTWTTSAWTAVVAGSTANVTGLLAVGEYDTAAGGFVGGTYAAANTTATLARSSASGAAPATTERVKPLVIVQTAAGAIDLTVRIAGFQSEQAAAATAYVSTTSNTGTWNTRMPHGPDVTVNGEQQYYPDVSLEGTAKSGGINPFSVSNSVLSITGRASTGGANGKPYVSGLLTTQRGFERAYGYFECRAKLPSGNGWWPAFWLLSPNAVGAGSNPEIDVMEQLGRLPNDVFGTLHWFDGAGNTTRRSPQVTAAVGSQTTAFHRYGLEWTPDRFTWYFDGQPFGTIQYGPGSTDPTFGAVDPTGQLRAPQYLILNLAMGGDWPGTMDAAAVPGTLEVDYVKVWDARPAETAPVGTTYSEAATDGAAAGDASSGQASATRTAADGQGATDAAASAAQTAIAALAEPQASADAATGAATGSAPSTADGSGTGDAAGATAATATRASSDASGTGDTSAASASGAAPSADGGSASDAATAATARSAALADGADAGDAASAGQASATANGQDAAGPQDAATASSAAPVAAADTASAADASPSPVSAATPAVSDGAAAGDVAGASAAPTAAATDAVTAQDARAASASTARSASDASAPGDAGTASATGAPALADVAGPNDTTAATGAASRAATDAGEAADAASGADGQLATATDEVGASDQASAGASASRAASDGATAGDGGIASATPTRAGTDGASASEAASATTTALSTSADGAEPSDRADLAGDETLPDTAGTGDAAGAVSVASAGRADGAGASDLATGAGNALAGVPDAAAPADPRTASAAATAQATDATGAGDTVASITAAVRQIADAAEAGDTAEASVGVGTGAPLSRVRIAGRAWVAPAATAKASVSAAARATAWVEAP